MLHPRFSCLALALLSFPLAVACGYGDHDHRYYDDGYAGNNTGGSSTSTPSGNVEQATIDADELLDVEPGDGAGAFIEYESGGTYHITTSCDVAGGVDCAWDIVVTPLDGAPLESLTPVDLEKDDTVTIGSPNAVRLVASTGRDFDGFSFKTDPGAAIEVDALLDDAPANRFLFWVGDGALHGGAPSNPVDLIPNKK